MATIDDPCDFGTPEPCGVNPAYTYTRYPCDFDDRRPGDTRGITLVVDLQTPVIGEVANRQTEAILAIEGELGIQPSGTFTTVRHRLDQLDVLLCDMWQRLGAVSVQEDGSTVVSQAKTFNFTGSVNVSQTDDNTAEINILGGDGYTPVHEALEVTGVSQTEFTLSHTPSSPSTVLLWIEGVKAEIGDYSVTNTTLTWSGFQTLIPGDIVEVLYFRPPSGSSSDGGGGGTFVQKVFTATSGQVSFTLDHTPLSQESVQMFISGVHQTVGVDFTLSGNTVTYDDDPSLDGEVVVINYFR